MGGPIRAFIESSPYAAVSAPAQTAVGTTAGAVLVANAKRKGFYVQNTGTTIIRLTFGTTMPTQTVYHLSLKASAVADDGSGGLILESNWVGQVNAISSAVSGTCVITELTVGSPDWNQAGDWGVR